MTPSWATSCPDWKERIVAGQSLIPFDPLFPAEAEAASAIFDDLVLKDVAGKPTIGKASRPWFRDFARSIFGSYNPETGERLIQNYFLCISKKNAKSTLAAGVMLTALLRNWRESGEFYILAPTLEVANNSYFPLRDFLKEDDELRDILHAQDHLKMITHRTTGAFLKVVASDSETVSGKKGIGVFVDELWQFGKKANAGPMLIEATGGLVSRPEGFVVYATTHSDEPPAGIFKEKLDYFRSVRDGRINDPFSLPVIYEWPEEMAERKDYLEKKWWFVTNPNLGASVSEKWIEAKLAEYQSVGEHAVRDFVAKHLNVEIGQTLRGDRWVGADYWEAAGDKSITLDALLEESDVVTVGIDNGGADDLFGLVVLGRAHDDGEETIRKRVWQAWGHAWCNSSAIERRKREASKFHDFERDGDLTIVDRDGDLLEQVGELVARIDKTGKLASIGLDKIGMPLLVDALSESLPDKEERLIPVPQGFQLMGYAQAVEWKLRDGTFKHAAQPLMAYAVSNAKVEPKGNAIVITKAASGWAKIDPLMALLDAVAPMSLNPAANSISVFDVMARKSTSSPAQSDDDDESILANPAHPQWQEARERWERKHLSTDDIWG